MNESDTNDVIRDSYERNCPTVDVDMAWEMLKTRMAGETQREESPDGHLWIAPIPKRDEHRRSSTTNVVPPKASAPGRNRGPRVAIYASIAVILVAAVATGTIMASRYLGRDRYVLTIGDETTVTSTTTTGPVTTTTEPSGTPATQYPGGVPGTPSGGGTTTTAAPTTTTGSQETTTTQAASATTTSNQQPDRWAKSAVTLDQLRATLEGRTQGSEPIWLPDRLPASWAVAQSRQSFPEILTTPNGKNPWIGDPAVSSWPCRHIYAVIFTDGRGLAELSVYVPGDWPELPFETVNVSGRRLQVYDGPDGVTVLIPGLEGSAVVATPGERDVAVQLAASLSPSDLQVTTTTSAGTAPSPLTPDDVMKVVSDWNAFENPSLRSAETFGDWAVAIVDDKVAPPSGPSNVGYIYVFRWLSSAWTVYELSSFGPASSGYEGQSDLIWRLQTEGMPDDVVQWIKTQMSIP